MQGPTDNGIRIGGNEQVLRDLYDRYYARLCFYAGRYVAQRETAEDIVQDVFVGMWERKAFFPNETALNAFLYTSVYNACMNSIARGLRLEKHHRRIQSLSAVAEEWEYVGGRIEEEVMWKILTAVESLPEECRKIFKLSYLEGMDLRQVSEALNISVHTVKSQRARAKKLLQERLQGLFGWCVLLFFP